MVDREGVGIAAQVRAYIAQHPSVGEALALGIVNNSALARVVATEIHTHRLEAVGAACKRVPRRRAPGPRETAVRGVLRRSRIETRSRVSVVTLTRSPQVLLRLSRMAKEMLEEGQLFRLIQGSQGTVVIVDDEAREGVLREIPKDQLLRVRKGLVEVGVVSPESIEDVPGIMARLSSVLAAADLNVLEAMSCYTDTFFIVEEKDMGKAFEVLRAALAP